MLFTFPKPGTFPLSLFDMKQLQVVGPLLDADAPQGPLGVSVAPVQPVGQGCLRIGNSIAADGYRILASGGRRPCSRTSSAQTNHRPPP
jgi:hypothetical protein